MEFPLSFCCNDSPDLCTTITAAPTIASLQCLRLNFVKNGQLVHSKYFAINMRRPHIYFTFLNHWGFPLCNGGKANKMKTHTVKSKAAKQTTSVIRSVLWGPTQCKVWLPLEALCVRNKNRLDKEETLQTLSRLLPACLPFTTVTDWENALLQCVHLNGFSPVWIWVWYCRPCEVEKPQQKVTQCKVW